MYIPQQEMHVKLLTQHVDSMGSIPKACLRRFPSFFGLDCQEKDAHLAGVAGRDQVLGGRSRMQRLLVRGLGVFAASRHPGQVFLDVACALPHL